MALGSSGGGNASPTSGGLSSGSNAITWGMGWGQGKHHACQGVTVSLGRKARQCRPGSSAQQARLWHRLPSWSSALASRMLIYVTPQTGTFLYCLQKLSSILTRSWDTSVPNDMTFDANCTVNMLGSHICDTQLWVLLSASPTLSYSYYVHTNPGQKQASSMV